MDEDQKINTDIQDKEVEETASKQQGNKVEENTSEDAEKVKEITPEEKILELEDKLARAFAEMENQRRRFEKEKDDAFNYGGFAFAKETLNLIDNLERSKQILKNDEALKNSETLKKILALKSSILYLPVTLIRMMRSIYHNIQFNKKNIKTVGSMGEPLANEVGKWLVKKFSTKNSPIINTYFQTETGGIVTAHKYNQKINDKLYGSVGIPIRNQLNLNKLNNEKKEIKIISPWPGQMKNVLNGMMKFLI